VKEGPISLKMTNTDKVVGSFVVLYRSGVGKTPAKIISIDVENGQIDYELIAGPDKGMKFRAEYSEGQSALCYTMENVNLAILET
jgi:hypothetical protein